MPGAQLLIVLRLFFSNDTGQLLVVAELFGGTVFFVLWILPINLGLGGFGGGCCGDGCGAGGLQIFYALTQLRAECFGAPCFIKLFSHAAGNFFLPLHGVVDDVDDRVFA